MLPTVKPAWFKIRPPLKKPYLKVREVLKENNLVTVCEEATCPNIAECWSSGTATFMILGDTCTRACKFCATLSAASGEPLDPNEPENLAKAVELLNLKYVVLTSVDRDDLPDGGSAHFAACIKACKDRHPDLLTEVLIPDYRNENLKRVVDARPNVLAHNIETIRRLQLTVRDPRAGYESSLTVLKEAKEMNPNIFTKSAIMLGLGETKEEVIEAMQDLRNVNCDVLTLGQYLKPKNKHLPVQEYVHPATFDELKNIGEKMGFLYLAAGPFVRSSYKAGELFLKNLMEKNAKL
ncbi:lipoyl synthase [Patescibacteria group bacterium]|nr:lipoyl synthase [Patescibacteria group bacterium]